LERLVFEASDDPRISIVIVGWRSAPHLHECLQALHCNVGSVAYEVLISLNEPSEQVRRWMRREVRGVGTVTSSVNNGFAAACNRAVAKSRGEFVFLLNDDVQICPGALQALLDTMESHPEAGAAGSKFLFPDGRLQEAGVVLWSDASVLQISHLLEPSDAVVDTLRRADYCSGAALLVRRSLWDEVGGLDEGYFPAYYEDVDLCLKIAAIGKIVLYQPRAVVRHALGSGSSLDYRLFLIRRNRLRVLDRWSGLLAEQDPAPVSVTPKDATEAVLKTSDKPPRAEPWPLPPPFDRRRSSLDYAKEELDLMRGFARELEEGIAWRDRDLATADSARQSTEEDLRSIIEARDRQLDEVVARMEGAERELDRSLLRIETLASVDRMTSRQMESILKSRRYRLLRSLGRLGRWFGGS
jgi:GT2 family glycosyltransferase